MKRYLAAIAGILALATPALAADKGAPNATIEQIIAARKPMEGCYVETSLAGTFLRSNREAQGGIGGGCDVILANLVIGAGLRADLADWRNTGSVFAKLGVAINNGATIYTLAEWKVPEFDPKKAGQLAIGGGAELQLSIINENLRAFAEGTFAASKFGAVEKDEIATRIGIRYKF